MDAKAERPTLKDRRERQSPLPTLGKARLFTKVQVRKGHRCRQGDSCSPLTTPSGMSHTM